MSEIENMISATTEAVNAAKEVSGAGFELYDVATNKTILTGDQLKKIAIGAGICVATATTVYFLNKKFHFFGKKEETTEVVTTTNQEGSSKPSKPEVVDDKDKK